MMRYFSLVLAFTGVAAMTSTSAQGPTVETIQLGSVEPGAVTAAVAINSRSVVVGTSHNRSTGVIRDRVFTWTRSGGFRVVVEKAQATDINDRGVVTGQYYPCAYGDHCAPRGFSWSPSTGLVDLGDFTPYAINNRGTMVGFVHDVTGPSIRIDGELRRLPDGFIPIDINERDAVAGEDRIDFDQRERHPAVWAPRLGLLRLDRSGRQGSVTSINESGMVSGSSAGGTDVSGAALFTPLGRALLTALPYGANAEAISDRGWVVGQANFRPALWILGGRMLTLPMPGATRSGTAVDVNDAGHIIGRSGTGSSELRSYFWIVR